MLVHDDTARINWKLAVIESVNKGADGLVRSANIRTATGRTNCPIAHLYPLEVTATEMTVKPSTVKMPQSQDSDQPVPPSNRPVREAARRGQEQMKEWISYLRAPRRMSWTVINIKYIYIDMYCGFCILLTCV